MKVSIQQMYLSEKSNIRYVLCLTWAIHETINFLYARYTILLYKVMWFGYGVNYKLMKYTLKK